MKNVPAGIQKGYYIFPLYNIFKLYKNLTNMEHKERSKQLHNKIKDLSKEIDGLDKCINKLSTDCTDLDIKEAEKHTKRIISFTENINNLI